jgi:chromosome segregation ATPase
MELIGEGLYEGAYLNEAQAMSAAKKALKGRDMQIKENIKKGNSKISELEDQIENLKIDIKAKQSKAIDEPGMRDSLVADVDDLMSKLDKKEAMLNKLKSALEKSSPKKEKKETKDDE